MGRQLGLISSLLLFFVVACQTPTPKLSDKEWPYLWWRKTRVEPLPFYLFIDINKDHKADILEWYGAASSDESLHRGILIKGEVKKLTPYFLTDHPLDKWRIVRVEKELRPKNKFSKDELELIKVFFETRFEDAWKENDDRRDYEYYRPLF